MSKKAKDKLVVLMFFEGVEDGISDGIFIRTVQFRAIFFLSNTDFLFIMNRDRLEFDGCLKKIFIVTVSQES